MALSVETDSQACNRSVILRQELKEWEQQFAANNADRKAGREDIKKHPAIGTIDPHLSCTMLTCPLAAKYKEYTKLRDVLSGKSGSHQHCAYPSQHRPGKRKADLSSVTQPSHTSKRIKNIETPSKAPHPAAIDPYDSPSAIRALLGTPTRRTAIGPTPQRDGKALGLFDLLSEDEAAAGDAAGSSRLQSPGSKSHLTPRRAHQAVVASPLHGSRTPTSSGKRFLLDSFATPSKRKAGGTFTPLRSASKLQFSTPAFLRRDRQRVVTLDAVAEEGPIRMPARPPIRGLSSMLASLRKMEDEQLDDELDVLRELENESIEPAKPSMMEDQGQGVSDLEGTKVGSQEQDESRNGKPARVWKKRGQKRTTKRVIMRPVRSKPRPTKTINHDHDGEHDGDDESAQRESVQHQSNPHFNPDDDRAPSNSDDADYDSTASQPRDRRQEAADARLVQAEMDRASHRQEGTDEGPVKRAARKISAQAHANFRRLKIRSQGKGKGKFGRGRR